MKHGPFYYFSLFVLASIIIFFSCVSNLSTAKVVDQKKIPLKTAYEPYFPIGAAISVGEYGFDSLTAYTSDLLQEYNSLTAENCMKPSVLQPSEGQFVWKWADKIIAYAKTNGFLVRGHALVWHQQTGSWMFSSVGSIEEKKAFSQAKMQAHIQAVVSRYADKIYAWDVVNEAITDGNGTYRTDSPWFKAYADASYIQDAFRFANAADPDCKLFYNDYSIETATKRDKVVQMIEELGLINLGLDGVGIQAHWRLDWPRIEDIQETIDVFNSMGLEVQFTELDIDCYNGSGDKKVLPYAGFQKALTQRYKEIFDCFRKNANKISGVTFWGVADDHTWLDNFYGNVWHNEPKRKNYPLLFDVKGLKKDAYLSVRDF